MPFRVELARRFQFPMHAAAAIALVTSDAEGASDTNHKFCHAAFCRRLSSARRRQYIEELVNLVPLHPVTLQTGYLVGQIEGQEAAKGKRAAVQRSAHRCGAIEQGYAVLTENLRHFDKVPGVRVLRL
jgi:predicted nucleic acid-binding protein